MNFYINFKFRVSFMKVFVVNFSNIVSEPRHLCLNVLFWSDFEILIITCWLSPWFLSHVIFKDIIQIMSLEFIFHIFPNLSIRVFLLQDYLIQYQYPLLCLCSSSKTSSSPKSPTLNFKLVITKSTLINSIDRYLSSIFWLSLALCWEQWWEFSPSQSFFHLIYSLILLFNKYLIDCYFVPGKALNGR